MSDSIRAAIANWSTNSLSPDACVLIPCRSPIHGLYRVDGPEPVENATAVDANDRHRWMAATRLIGGGW